MKKNKAGFAVFCFICGVIIGAIIGVMIGMFILRNNNGQTTGETTNPTTSESTSGNGSQTETEADAREENSIAVITVGDQTISMLEMNVYLYQLRDFYTTQYGESPWNTTMDDGTLLGDYAKNELYNGLVRTEILIAKAGDYNVELTDEEKQQCADEAQTYVDGLGSAICQNFGLTLEGVTTVNENEALSTKVYNAALDQLAAETGETSDEALAEAFEELYTQWQGEYTVETDPIWDNIVVGSVG